MCILCWCLLTHCSLKALFRSHHLLVEPAQKQQVQFSHRANRSLPRGSMKCHTNHPRELKWRDLPTCVQINHFRRANRGTGSTSTCTPPKKNKKALARGLERKPPENVHKHTAERFCSPSTNHLANCVFEHIEVNARPNSHWKLFPLTRALKCLGSRPCQHQWAPPSPLFPFIFFPLIFWLRLCFSSLCSPSCLTAAIQFWQRRFWCNSAGCECHPLIHGHFNENGERNFK